jgi:hypothetical protein
MARSRSASPRIEVEQVDAEASPAAHNLALRTLARLMIRNYQGNGDPAANVATSSLTVPRDPSPHRDDEAA